MDSRALRCKMDNSNSNSQIHTEHSTRPEQIHKLSGRQSFWIHVQHHHHQFTQQHGGVGDVFYTQRPIIWFKHSIEAFVCFWDHLSIIICSSTHTRTHTHFSFIVSIKFLALDQNSIESKSRKWQNRIGEYKSCIVVVIVISLLVARCWMRALSNATTTYIQRAQPYLLSLWLLYCVCKYDVIAIRNTHIWDASQRTTAETRLSVTFLSCCHTNKMWVFNDQNSV